MAAWGSSAAAGDALRAALLRGGQGTVTGPTGRAVAMFSFIITFGILLLCLRVLEQRFVGCFLTL